MEVCDIVYTNGGMCYNLSKWRHFTSLIWMMACEYTYSEDGKCHHYPDDYIKYPIPKMRSHYPDDGMKHPNPKDEKSLSGLWHALPYPLSGRCIPESTLLARTGGSHSPGGCRQ